MDDIDPAGARPGQLPEDPGGGEELEGGEPECGGGEPDLEVERVGEEEAEVAARVRAGGDDGLAREHSQRLGDHQPGEQRNEQVPGWTTGGRHDGGHWGIQGPGAAGIKL